MTPTPTEQARPLTDEELLGKAATAADRTPTIEETDAAPATPAAPEDTLEDLLVELPAAEREAFAVRDEQSAEWVLDKLLSMDERIARYTRQTTAKLGAMKKDRERFAGRFLPQLQAYAEANRPDRIKEKGPKFLDLDAGRVGFRIQARHATVTRKEEAIAYLYDYGALVELLKQPETTFDQAIAYMEIRPPFANFLALAIETANAEGEDDALGALREALAPTLAGMIREEPTTILDADALRKHVLATGEVIPGVAIVDETENFYFQAPAK